MSSSGPTNDKDNILADLKALDVEDAETLLNLFTTELKGSQNDNTLLLERTVQLLSSQPPSSSIGKSLTASFVNTLWSALPHPPLRSLGSQYKYREADGSNNNIRIPDLGKAGNAYAKSVQAKRPQMQGANLPDPAELFDSLMTRGKEGDVGSVYEEHPMGISSVLFYLATIIIHDLFLTDRNEKTTSKTSSYLDLAPLYGCNQEEQNDIRTFEDGKLKPDCFSSKRILGFPPGVGVMLIMFNRFHNYVVGMLAQINDNNRFPKPQKEAPKEAWLKYDNDLFQTGRLVTCGLYVNIVLKDYVRTILALNRTNSIWDLDPRVEETRTLLNTPAGEAVGNQVSAEFNLIYRWHSAISRKDEKWTEGEYAKLFPDKDPSQVTLSELLQTLQKSEDDLPTDPSQRSFASLTRTPEGTYEDTSLVDLLKSSIQDPASSFGSNRIPPILRSIEILSILQSRQWGMATLNEFRTFVGLTPHTSFSDINPDVEVAGKLKEFYGTPDNVELYPGVVIEKSKPPVVPGSGLCVGFSIGYAILSDAVGLVRGDRFYTEDWGPVGMTNWGFNEVQYDTNIDAGCVLHKLILRSFPNHFVQNSIYAHFPFVTPATNLEIHKSLGTDSLYSWDEPTQKPELGMASSWKECSDILEDSKNWAVTWGAAIESLTKGEGKRFCLAGEGKENGESREVVTGCFYPSTKNSFGKTTSTLDWGSSLDDFYVANFGDLVSKHRVKIAGKENSYRIDVVGLVKRCFTRFAAGFFGIPLIEQEGEDVEMQIDGKESTGGSGDEVKKGYTEEELYAVLEKCFICIFEDVDVTRSFEIRKNAREAAGTLGEVLMERAKEVGTLGGAVEEGVQDLLGDVKNGFKALIGGVEEKVEQQEEKKEEGIEKLRRYGDEMIKRFLDAGKEKGWGMEEVVWGQMLPTSAAMTANQSQVLNQVLDFYLSEPGAGYLPRLHELANMNPISKENEEELLRFFLEAARLSCNVATFRTSSSTSTSTSTKPQTLLLNLPLAHLDPEIFPNPQVVDLTRPLDKYLMFGLGKHACVGRDVATKGMVRIFREIVKFRGLRWKGATGGKGGLKTVDLGMQGKGYMDEEWGSVGPFPVSGWVEWDE